MTIQERLAAVFPANIIKAKPQVVQGARALVAFYINARDVMNRLDEVLGVANWKDDYEVAFEKKLVICRLSCRLEMPGGGTEWVTKTDVGTESKQPDEGNRFKAAFSSALKRAALKFGVGRYIEAIPNTWLEYNEQKKCFAKRPLPPPEFLPQLPNAVAGAKDQGNAQSTAHRNAFVARYANAKTTEEVNVIDLLVTKAVQAATSPADLGEIRNARSARLRELEKKEFVPKMNQPETAPVSG